MHYIPNMLPIKGPQRLMLDRYAILIEIQREIAKKMERINKASLLVQCALILVLVSSMAPRALAETEKNTTVHSTDKDHNAVFAYTARKTLPSKVFLPENNLNDNAAACDKKGCAYLPCCSGCNCVPFIYACVGRCG